MPDNSREFLEGRKGGFSRFLEERMDVLSEFASGLGFGSPQLIVAQPSAFVEAIDRYMSCQDISEDDFSWIVSRIGYFIGEVLIERYSGCWMIVDDTSSRLFARYVVGQFPGRAMVVDPFEAAVEYVRAPKGRSLVSQLSAIEDQLQRIGARSDDSDDL